MVFTRQQRPVTEGLVQAGSTPRCASQSSYGINAPEVDQSVHAPQPYHLPEGLQQAIVEGPEIAYSTNCLEAAPITEPPEVHDKLLLESKRRRRNWLRLSLLLCILAVVISVGIGLGVGLGKDHASSDASTTTSSPISTTISSLTSITSSTFSTVTASSTPTPLVNGVLNDTSLASVTTPDNDRHLFFQDINGTLRHAIFSGTQNAWLPSVGFINPDPQRQPKNHTPISALDVTSSFAPVEVSGTQINIYYVDVNNTLAAVQYGNPSQSGVPNTYDKQDVLLNSSFSVHADTRSLSISQLLLPFSNQSFAHPSPPFVFNNVFLLSESPTRNVTILQGSFFPHNYLADPPTDSWIWRNISAALSPATAFAAAGDWISSPFSASVDPLGDLSGCFFNPHSVVGINRSHFFLLEFANHPNASNLYNSSSGAMGVFPDPIPSNTSEYLSALSTGAHDVLCIEDDSAFAINGTFYSPFGSPNSMFPFYRLAYANVSGSFYLYHQFSESVIYEEVNQIGLGSNGWGKPNAISIPIK